MSFDLIRGFQVEFLKIDGSIIYNILRDPVDLAKIPAMCVAKDRRKNYRGVGGEKTTAKLREIGIDFAQGFGISRPRPRQESPKSRAVTPP